MPKKFTDNGPQFKMRDYQPCENLSSHRFRRVDLTIEEMMDPGWVPDHMVLEVGAIVWLWGKDGMALTYVSAKDDEGFPLLSFVQVGPRKPQQRVGKETATQESLNASQ